MIVFELRSLLKERGITEHQLMRKLGIRPGTFYAIANGEIKRVPVDVLDKLCTELGVQPCAIMRWVPEQKNSAP